MHTTAFGGFGGHVSPNTQHWGSFPMPPKRVRARERVASVSTGHARAHKRVVVREASVPAGRHKGKGKWPHACARGVCRLYVRQQGRLLAATHCYSGSSEEHVLPEVQVIRHLLQEPLTFAITRHVTRTCQEQANKDLAWGPLQFMPPPRTTPAPRLPATPLKGAKGCTRL